MVQKQSFTDHLLKCFSTKTFVHLKGPACCRSFKINFKQLYNLPSMACVYNLGIKPSCQTLSKVFVRSKNTLFLLTSSL